MNKIMKNDWLLLIGIGCLFFVMCSCSQETYARKSYPDTTKCASEKWNKNVYQSNIFGGSNE